MNELKIGTEKRNEYRTIAIELSAWDVLNKIKTETGTPIKDIATKMILFANDHVVVNEGEK